MLDEDILALVTLPTESMANLLRDALDQRERLFRVARVAVGVFLCLRSRKMER